MVDDHSYNIVEKGKYYLKIGKAVFLGGLGLVLVGIAFNIPHFTNCLEKKFEQDYILKLKELQQEEYDKLEDIFKDFEPGQDYNNYGKGNLPENPIKL